MSYKSIINAAPMTILLGTKDESGRTVPRERSAVPSHCPMTYFYAKKGPTTRQLVVGGSRTAMYGADSFDQRSKYANHATVFSNAINAEGNAQMMQRLIPTDAGPTANLTLWLEVVAAQIPDYQRNPDGSIKLDGSNAPVPVVPAASMDGFKARWVVTSDKTHVTAQTFGAKTVKPGTLTDGGATADMYPIMELKVSSIGEDGNNTGLRLWAPTTATTGQFDKRIMTRDKVFPIRMGVVRRNTKTQTSKLQETLFGEQNVLVTLKPDVINSIDDNQLSVTDVFLDAYQNLTDPAYPALFGEFGEMHVYDDNIQLLLQQFYEAEKDYVDGASANPVAVKHDFSTAAGPVADEEWLFNFISGQSSEAYPYHTFQLVTGGGSVRLNEYTNLFADGGSDGTMNDTLFAALVEEAMEDYADANSQVHNTAINVESIIYDSGFPLQTKNALFNFLANRQDTFVAVGTYEVGGPRLTASQDNSRAIALRTRAQLFPESEYFGTPVCRALIMGRSGKIRNHQFKKDISPLYEFAVKSARYMGASDGKWKTGKEFGGAPGSILNYMYDISVPFTAASVRNKDWDAGLNWVQSYDLSSNHFPALKTVYTDDTSVLNSYFTAMAIVEINKVMERAHRYYTGNDKLTDGQRAERVDRFIRENTEGRFDGRYIIEPNTYYTDADTARGYSWTTQVNLYSPSMPTVMTGFVVSRRMSDYVAQS